MRGISGDLGAREIIRMLDLTPPRGRTLPGNVSRADIGRQPRQFHDDLLSAAS